MAQFMILYKGEATDMSDMTEEQVADVMAKWGEWMEGLGASLTEVGNPFGPGSSLVDDGSSGTAVSLNGYSVVQADDMAGARALADGHPFLVEGRGAYAIDIYELMPVPGG
ncbi:MAG: YciI family protein [Actinomycetota bacterium]|nr:YciI family protein [Actinomycetota bacterium]MDK1017747.1 YciI family protein [Actinomycetota bacterium]MDK1026587.1 YciI family protein [Actinomycetota bacterium]MDK1038351.1 YciI family protein [Actinomycetota bacterium]MDK1097417.1 YciI family protein [Actinomycetota bacterium]